jgi:hypothetical protein
MGVLNSSSIPSYLRAKTPTTPTTPTTKLPTSSAYSTSSASGTFNSLLPKATPKTYTPPTPVVKTPTVNKLTSGQTNWAAGTIPLTSSQKSQAVIPTPTPVVSATPATPAMPTIPTPTYGAPTSDITPPTPDIATPPTPPTPTTPTPEKTIPEAPMTSEAQKAYDLAYKAYQQSSQISPEELSTQEDIDKLIEQTKLGYSAINEQGEGQATPLRFISGQLSAVERRATNLAEPLEAKMARLQSARTASLESSKFALENASKLIEAEKTERTTTAQEAEKTRQFNEQQKFAERELALKYSGAEDEVLSVSDAKALGVPYGTTKNEATQMGITVGDTTTSENQKKIDAGTTNINLVDEILGSDEGALNNVFGFGSSITSLTPGKTQLVKNQVEQLRQLLSLDSRQKLKGTGTISDYEAKMLAAASSALGTNLSLPDAKKVIGQIKEAFQRGSLKAKGYTQEEIDDAAQQLGGIENVYQSLFTKPLSRGENGSIVNISVNNKPITVSQTIADKVAKADADFYKATGKHLQINQSYRTAEQQAKLYAELKPKGAQVAKPGTSFHEKGLAIDVTNWQEAEKYLRKYGLVNPMSNDKGHFSYGEFT